MSLRGKDTKLSGSSTSPNFTRTSLHNTTHQQTSFESTTTSMRHRDLTQVPTECLPIKNLFVSILFKRLDSILPYKSGFSIAQVLADPYYIQLKSHILKLISQQRLINDIISAVYNSLVKILHRHKKSSLYNQSTDILNSIYILIFLLSSSLNAMKSKKYSNHPNLRLFQVAELTSTSQLLYSSNILAPPDIVLDDEISTKLLRLLLGLENDSACLSTLYEITLPVESSLKSSNLTQPISDALTSNYNFNSMSFNETAILSNSSQSNQSSASSHSSSSIMSNSTSNTSSSSTPISTLLDNPVYQSTVLNDHREVRSILEEKSKLAKFGLINLIDQAISSVLFYISASNPSRYLDFQKAIFKRINVESLYIKGSHMIQYTFLSVKTFNPNLQFIRDILNSTRRDSQRSLILRFFAESILSWALYRTDDFLQVFDHPNTCKNAESLFDIIHKQIEIRYSPRVYYCILGCLMLFQSKTISRFIESKSNKSTTQALKRSISHVTKLNSSKQKFLNDFSQLVTKSPENARPFIHFLLVGFSVGQHDKEHPLYKFVVFMREPMTKFLSLYDQEHSQNKLPQLASLSPHSTFSSLPKLTTFNSSTSTSSTNTNSNLKDDHSMQRGHSGRQDQQIEHCFDRSSDIDFKSKIVHELQVGVCSIYATINTTQLKSSISAIFSSNGYAMNLLSLYTGSFRLLIILPSLNKKILWLLQNLSCLSIKVLTLLADRSLEIYLNVLDMDPSQQDTPPTSYRMTPTSSSISSLSEVNRRSSDASKSSSFAMPSSNLASPTTNIGRLKSPISNNRSSKNSSPISASPQYYKKQGLSLTCVDNDESSIDSNEDDFDYTSFHHKDSLMDELNFKEPIDFTSLAKNISMCDPRIIKENLINLLVTHAFCPAICYPEVNTSSNSNGLIDFYAFERTFKKFIDRIARLLLFEDKEILMATEMFLLSFCDTVSSNNALTVFTSYIGTSVLVDAVSAIGLSPEITNEKRNRIIKLILKLLEQRYENANLKLMYDHRHMIDTVHKTQSCRRIIKNFERIVFVGLFSSNIETIRCSKRVLQFYIFVITNPHHLPYCFDKSNLELAQNILSDKMTFGIVSIRKKIRDHLSHIKKPTDVFLDVWILMYKKISSVYHYDDVPPIDGSIETIDNYFSNLPLNEDMEIYSEYMVSLGGIIMAKCFENDVRQPSLRRKLETFITNKFLGLFCKEVKKRESSKEILSVSVHPFLCEIMLKNIELMLPRFELYLKTGQYNICELFISVVKSICQAEGDSLFPYAVSLWECNFKLLEMFNISNNTPEFLRLKIKFCKLQVLFLSKLEDLSLNGSILGKNHYARIAANYLESSFDNEGSKTKTKVLTFSIPKTSTVKSQKKMSSKMKEFKETELSDLQMDLRIESSTMLKLIFYRLPLDSMSHNYAGSEDDMSAANVVFSNYFNLFVRLLEKTDGLKKESSVYAATNHRSALINKEVIQALINLLNANFDIGLKYSLPLGNHANELIRISFIDVFSNIIKVVYENTKAIVNITEYYKEGVELLTSDTDLFLAASVNCPKSDLELFATSILQLQIPEKKRMELYIALINYDILHTYDKNEILRSNTVATRVTALYSYDEAVEYLIGIFRPIFQDMLNNENYFEVEKVEHQNEEEKEKNLAIFFEYLNRISCAIYNSIDNMPIGIRLIARTIYDTSRRVMPGIEYTPLNAYLFLRLINPTIVSPERLGIVDSVNPPFKRSLIQLARVCQSLVNEAPIRLPIVEDKEEELAAVRGKLFAYMREIVDFEFEKAFNKLDDSITEDPKSILDNSTKENSLYYLHSFFYDHNLSIRKTYCNISFGYTTMDKKIEHSRWADRILSKLKIPRRLKEYQIPESVKNDKSPKGILLYDFMTRTALASEDFSFIKVLITKDGLPMICISTLELDPDFSVTTYTYGFLQTVTKFWESPFCCLVDLTSFSDFTLFEKVRNMAISMLPSHFASNCKRTYLLNMSSSFFLEFKKIAFNFEEDIATDFVFMTTNDDLKTMNKNNLVGYVNPVSHDSRVSFHDVSIYQESSNRFIPVKLKIGDQFLQISSALPQRIKILNKMHVVNLVDCYKLSDLSDINSSSYTGVANEISFMNIKTNTRIILTSVKKIEIMRTLYFSRARLNNNVYVEDDHSDSSNPKFIVGQLLNTAFCGLTSEADEIRKSSYALLASIKQSANLKTELSIESIDGVIFPYGNNDYIIQISANIARNHPDLTYAFIHGFFNGFTKMSDEEKKMMVLCVSPWVKNIYRYVYHSDSLMGPTRTREIIRKYVLASRENINHKIFSLFIWPQLSLEDGLIDIIIDEIVTASIDYEAEGNDWNQITKYWPLKSSIEICSVIISRLKEKSYNLPLKETEIEAHTRWIETTVLAKFLSYLIFDSLLFVDRYIGDIFYIVTIYMDYGPLEFRRSLLHLLTRTFHSYLSKPHLKAEQHQLIRNQIELLNGARFRMLFGLTRQDGENFLTPNLIASEISTKAIAVSTLCNLLTKFLEYDLDQDEYALQMVKWNSSVSKIAFNNNSQLQPRGILVLGSLTKQGVSSRLILKFVELVQHVVRNYARDNSNRNPPDYNMIVCTMHAFGKCIDGINSKSSFHPLMFWGNLTTALSENVNTFIYSISFIRLTFMKIYEYLKETDISLVDYLLQYKNEHFNTVEEAHGFSLTRETFDIILVSLCCKGLESPISYDKSVTALKSLLEIRYAEHIRFSTDIYNDYMCYMFFIYLTANSDEELISSIEQCGLKDLEYIDGGICKIPKCLVDWFVQPTLNVYSTSLGTTNYYMNQKLDELASNRVIAFILEVYKFDPKTILRLYKHIKKILEKFVESSGAPSILEKVLDVIIDVINIEGYECYETFDTEWVEKMRQHNINGISEFILLRDNLPENEKVYERRAKRLDMYDMQLQIIEQSYKEKFEEL